jgi:putative aminopeptidase FrvX
MKATYGDYILKEAAKILAVPSPSGYTEEAAKMIIKEFEALGCKAWQTVKGGVMVDFGGKNKKNAILLEAHMDTLGAMVAEVKGNGRLRVLPLGGMNANNAEAENCKVITKFNGEYEGTLQLCNASIHVNGDYNDIKRGWDKMEVVLDEVVKTKADVEKLGIGVGDVVCFDPRTVITKKGYIKSRFLDDKLSVAILLGYAKYLKDEKKKPARQVYAHITVYEEVGHGGSASVPENVTEAISVDMGCVGDGLQCDERQVSICAKDSGGPYAYDVVKGLIEAAKRAKADYAVDIYPYYGSDVEATLRAGYDIKHGLIGAGVYASHGYERSHKDGALATLKLIAEYIG